MSCLGNRLLALCILVILGLPHSSWAGGGPSCTFLLGQGSGEGPRGQETQNDFGRKFDSFFVTTNRFRNLVFKYDHIGLDGTSTGYHEMIGLLRSKILERKAAIEAAMKTPETVSYVPTKEGDLLIKFNQSKTFILLELNKVTRQKEHDDKWDRDYISESRSAFPDEDTFYGEFRKQVESLGLPGTDKLVCHGVCRHFFEKRVPSPSAPKGYEALSEKEKEIVRRRFATLVRDLPDDLAWSIIHDKHGNPYLAKWYQGGLMKYLNARRVPANRRGNYRVGWDGQLEVNIRNEDFDGIPWGTSKRRLVEKLIKTYFFIKGIKLDLSDEELFASFLNLNGYSFSPEDLYLAEPEIRDRFLKALIEMNTAMNGNVNGLNERLSALREKLQLSHEEEFVRKGRDLLQKAKSKSGDNVGDSYFQIGDVKAPLVEFSSLPAEVQEYLSLDERYETINRILDKGDFLSKTGSQSIFRAPTFGEWNLESGVLNLPIETNFEPYEGMQVHYFAAKDGYTGSIIEVQNIPHYLLYHTKAHSGVHPEVRLRFPVTTRHFRVLGQSN